MNVQVTQLVGKLEEMFSDNIDKRDLLKHQGEQLSDKIQSRCIAAYGVYWISGCSIEDAGKAVTDCDKDNGIDAIYYNENTCRLVIVQSKLIKNGSSEPSASEIKDFRSGIYDLIEGRLHKFDKKITDKKYELNKIKEFGTKFDIILAYTSRDELATPANDTIKEMLSDLNGDDSDEDPCFSFHLLSRKKMTDSLTYSLGKRNIDVEFALTDYGIVDSPFDAYYGKITGAKLFEWWNIYADALYRENIRNSLGITPVNTLIAKTLNEKPDHFWYFNNGITIICDEIKQTAENRTKRDFRFFKAVNASIVNGAQTYSTIGKAGKKGVNLDSVNVFLRVIQTGKENEVLKNEITKYNNTQNSILPKDFISQDPVQINLQTQLALADYNYIIKRDEKIPDGSKTIHIDKSIEALVIASQRPNYAALFRKEIGRFQNPESTQYKAIFNESTNHIFLINMHTLNTAVDLKLPEISKKITLQRPDLIKIENIAESGSLIIKQIYFKSFSKASIKELSEKITEWIIDVEKIEDIVVRITEIVNRKYRTNYIVTLFQNTEKCTEIFNEF